MTLISRDPARRRPRRPRAGQLRPRGGGRRASPERAWRSTRRRAGYSVALVERHDFASGTSSRSSKLVHGGLRYLQNFDLGLVREALLERSLMVKLAPAPGSAAAAARGRVRREAAGAPAGRRAAHVRRDGARAAGAATRDGDDEEWSPERHRIIDAEETRSMLPALAPRDPSAAYLFFDCQTDDARLVLTVLGEAERFGAVIANRCEVTGLVEREGRAAGVLVRDARRRRRVRGGGGQRGQRDRGVGRPGPARTRCMRRRRSADPPEPGDAPDCSRATPCTLRRGRHRAGGRRADDLRAAVAGAHAGRDHRQRLRGRARARAAGRGRHGVPARARATSSSAPRWA